MKYIKHIFLTLALVLFANAIDLLAQCAMCRATVENNVSNGETSIGAGLNAGILYLFAMPYLIAAIIGFLWYRAAKKRKTKFIFQGDKF
ncbi:hypothetical protein [Cecembia rubra]|uniref:Uncharacterized protein n=1 Tax=Cecembia rubra TaxID=1485585 RepID=A0A2P8E7R2_9BACT|nr:hypothetical protein [Cecembia rubra]PSL05499.1 hypothetical protein CLV48_1038 [Cecembia rubra]